MPDPRSHGNRSGFRNTAALFLVALALAGLFLLLAGDLMHRFLGGPEGTDDSDVERWLDEHEEEATRMAEKVLAGASPLEVARPGSLARVLVREWPDAVSFTLSEGGFKELARGLCYSPSGRPPPLGTFEEGPVRWTHLRDRWYAFAAE